MTSQTETASAVHAHRDRLLDAAAGAHDRYTAEARVRSTALGTARGMADSTPGEWLRTDLRALFAGLDLALDTIGERYPNG